jgi:hypothetical protein
MIILVQSVVGMSQAVMGPGLVRDLGELGGELQRLSVAVKGERRTPGRKMGAA